LLPLSLAIAEGSKCEPGVLKHPTGLPQTRKVGWSVHRWWLLFRCFKLLTYKLYEVFNISEAMGQTHQANIPRHMEPNQNCILSVVSEQQVFVFTQQPFQNWLVTSSFMTSSFEVVHCFYKKKFQSGSKPLNMIHLFHQLFKKTGLLPIMGCCTHVSLQLQFCILRSCQPYHSTQLDEYRGWIEFPRHNNTRWTSNFLHLSYWILELRAYRDNDWALALIIAMSSVVTTFNMFRQLGAGLLTRVVMIL
jgi:hypothetical protein